MNLIVNQYLEFAELQAMNRKPMRMVDWIEKLHGFLKLNDREILADSGKVSHKDAEKHAHAEFEKYRSAEAKRIAESDGELDTEIKKFLPTK